MRFVLKIGTILVYYMYNWVGIDDKYHQSRSWHSFSLALFFGYDKAVKTNVGDITQATNILGRVHDGMAHADCNRRHDGR